MDSDGLDSHAREACRVVLQELPLPIDDYRLPPPDIMGHFADRNIKKFGLLDDGAAQ